MIPIFKASPCTVFVCVHVLLALSSFFPLAQCAGAQTSPFVTEQIPVGLSPQAIAVNPVTNKTYVANTGSNTLTIIDGATGSPTFLGVGNGPSAIGINTATNKIYVADSGGVEVDVIDGATNAITPVLVGYHPESLAVNPVTNQIYVANAQGDNLTVIDGATNATSTIATGVTPRAIAVNMATNTIYVANWSSNDVTVIDGSSGTTSTVTVGTNPRAIAVNAVTNQIYVANYGSNSVSDIDGPTGNTTTIAVGSKPISIAVNQVSNQIYVADYASSNLSIISGATNTATTVQVGIDPGSIAINETTNQIYVACQSNSSLFQIDGATHNVTTLPIGGNVLAVALNPVTGRLYAANQSGNSFGTNNVAFIQTSVLTTNEITIPPTIPGPSVPTAAAINPVTKKIYVATSVPYNGPYAGNLLVIDATTKVITSLGGYFTESVAINPVTNKIYATNPSFNQVTVIDGSTNTMTSFNADGPTHIDINPASNMLYITDSGGSAQLAVVSGLSNATLATFPGFSGPVAINTLTNKIYAWSGASEIAEIDGETNTISYIPETSDIASYGGPPVLLAVNPVSNKLYAAYSFLNNNGFFTVDLATKHNTYSVDLGTRSPQGIALNPMTNKIYLATYDNAVTPGQCSLMVFDDLTNVATTAAIPSCNGVPSQPVVDTATDTIYFETEDPATLNTNNLLVEYSVDGATNLATATAAGNGENAQVGTTYGTGQPSMTPMFTILDPASHDIYYVGGDLDLARNSYQPTINYQSPVAESPNPLTAAVTPLAGNTASSASPTFTFTASSTYAPTAPPVRALYYQLDSEQGPWIAATGSAPDFGATLLSVAPGSHVIYYFATDGSDSTDISISQTSTGAVAAYPFAIVGP